GMHADLVAEMASDGGMPVQLRVELREITDIIDALLALPAKPRRQGLEAHAGARQLARDKEMLERAGGRECLIDGDLKIQRPALDEALIHFPHELQRLAVNQFGLDEFGAVK